MSYRERFLDDARLSFGIVKTTVERSANCGDITETTKFVLILFVIGLFIFGALRARYICWAFPSLLGYFAFQRKALNNILSTHLSPQLPGNAQSLLKSDRFPLDKIMVLLVFSSTLCIFAYTNSTKPLIQQSTIPEPSAEKDDPEDTLIVSAREWHMIAAAKKDWHSILGVPHLASKNHIDHEFRRRAWRYHPDQTQGDEDQTEVYKVCNIARQNLVEPCTSNNYLEHPDSCE